MPAQGGAAEVAGDVLDLVRSKLNELVDVAAGETPATFTDAVLLPFLNSSYRRLQKDLATAGVRHLRVNTTIAVPAGTTQLDDGALNGLLPSDFLMPLILLERPTGSAERATQIFEVFEGLPQRQPNPKLQVYEQGEDGALLFIGATQDLDVLLTYLKALPKLIDATSPLRIRGLIDALAARTAAHMARARGALVLAGDLRGEYEEEKALWLAEYWKHKQKSPARRRPYGSRRRLPYA